MCVCIPLAHVHSDTLRVADEVHPACCVLHYRVNSCLESLHLLPHGLQAGAPVEQVDDRHVRAGVGLREETARQTSALRHHQQSEGGFSYKLIRMQLKY